MKIKEKTKSTRLKEAAIEDGMNFIIGFLGYPFPMELLREAAKIFSEQNPENFVNWNMDNWMDMYYKELPNSLAIPYRGKNYLLPSIIIFDNSAKKFDLSKFKFVLIEEDYQLNSAIIDLTEEPYEKLVNYYNNNSEIKYANEQNLRLICLEHKNNEVQLNVQPVQFNDYLHTNLLLDVKSKEKNCTLREYIHKGGKLDDLSSSILANHVGIVRV